MKNIIKMENALGGKGCVTLECLLNEKQLNNKCGLYAHAIIEPGSTLGYHEHHGEAEAYYILSGKGLYNDNGKTFEVKAGDVVYCADGSGHGIDCIGNETLHFMALIIKA